MVSSFVRAPSDLRLIRVTAFLGQGKQLSAGPKNQRIDLGLFMSTTMKAATHLGENYDDNLFNWNPNFEALKTLFDITQKLTLNQKHEIRHVSTIKWQFTLWMRSTVLNDKAIMLSKAKIHVHSDSVLCLGKMHGHLDAMVKWKQLQYFQNSFEYRRNIWNRRRTI